MAAKATSDSADIPLGGIFHGVRPPKASAEHDLYEASADHSGEPFAQPV